VDTIALAVTVAVAAGCPSASTWSPPDSGGEAGSEADAASNQACDASLALAGDSGAAGCAACQASNCAPAMAECGHDCVCAEAVACLQMNDNAYSACSGAIAALSNGNTALMDLAGCTAMKCSGPPCFPGTSVSDAGGGGGG
jgi:hypothetical protein